MDNSLRQTEAPPPEVPDIQEFGLLNAYLRRLYQHLLDASILSQQTACNTLTIHPSGQTNNTDVTGINALFIDADGANAALISGFTGGVDGQVLYVSIIDHTKDVTLQHAEGLECTDLIMYDSADETLDNYGGWTFICNGTNWYDLSHAKHV